MKPSTAQLAFFTVVCLGIASQLFVYPTTVARPEFHPTEGSRNILIQNLCDVPFMKPPCIQPFHQFKTESECMAEAAKLAGGPIKFTCEDKLP